MRLRDPKRRNTLIAEELVNPLHNARSCILNIQAAPGLCLHMQSATGFRVFAHRPADFLRVANRRCLFSHNLRPMRQHIALRKAVFLEHGPGQCAEMLVDRLHS